jgi:hypothetical protein
MPDSQGIRQAAPALQEVLLEPKARPGPKVHLGQMAIPVRQEHQELLGPKVLLEPRGPAVHLAPNRRDG